MRRWRRCFDLDDGVPPCPPPGAGVTLMEKPSTQPEGRARRPPTQTWPASAKQPHHHHGQQRAFKVHGPSYPPAGRKVEGLVLQPRWAARNSPGHFRRRPLPLRWRPCCGPLQTHPGLPLSSAAARHGVVTVATGPQWRHRKGQVRPATLAVCTVASVRTGCSLPPGRCAPALRLHQAQCATSAAVASACS